MAEASEIMECKQSWVGGILNWSSSSPTMLRTVEKKILSFLRTSYRGWFVDIGSTVGVSDKIWTISLNPESQNTPLVLLHGLGSGVALWCLNLDAFAGSRPVYAIDILGFGRSSRPSFSSDAMEAEQQMVKTVEEWRREMKLDNMILLGHSMGGFLAASYAISHPERVKHLILADPWGFPERPNDATVRKTVPLWIRAIAFALQPLNPLWAVRAAGPFGQWVINKARPDLVKKFESFVPDANSITEYIYQCNSQSPTGESAFHAMMSGYGWAKNPMVRRINTMHEDVPITLVYGARSWVDNSAGEIVKDKRIGSYVKLQSIKGAGHHVYADNPEIFNRYVVEACAVADQNRNRFPAIKSSENTESDIESDGTPQRRIMSTPANS
ncbi:pummelig [Carabus blaptoides fortunei]